MKIFSDKVDGVTVLPVVGTLLLVVWTGSVYRYSKYGDGWAIWPAMLMLPFVLSAHVVLIARRKPRKAYSIYAAIHAVFFIPIWLGSLMLLSKDSL